MARNDLETWEALRRELEDIGISPFIISEKRQFIIAWFRDAVAAGKFEEEVPSDNDDGAIPVSEVENWASAFYDDNLSDENFLPTNSKPDTTETRVTARRSRPDAPDLSKQPAGSSNSRLPRKQGKSQLSVTYLLNKLLARDTRFIKAAVVGDVSQVKVLLDKGIDIEVRDSLMRTALLSASESGNEEIVRFLLTKGADIHAKDHSGDTALMNAAYCGHQALIQLLLEKTSEKEYKYS